MTKKTLSVHREILLSGLADALLNVPFAAAVGSQPEKYNSIGQRLAAAKTELMSAVAAANRMLVRNPLTGIIAEHAAKQAGKQGTSSVSVDLNGDVMLEVVYIPAGGPLPPSLVSVSTSPSRLPPIADLRREATLLGIDWELYGKSKKKLIAVMKAVRDGLAPALVSEKPQSQPPAPKPVLAFVPASEPAPVPEPTTPEPVLVDVLEPVWEPVEGPEPPKRITPLEDDDDVDDLFRQLESNGGGNKLDPEPVSKATPEPRSPVKLAPKPKPISKGFTMPAARSGVFSGTPAPKLHGRSLSAIAAGAEDDIDIDTILAEPAPEILQED